MSDNINERLHYLELYNASLQEDLAIAAKTRDDALRQLAEAKALLDSMAVKGMLEGETEVECLQRQLAQARKENGRLACELEQHAKQMEELTRYRKMERMVYEFGEAKEQLESIVETLGAYIKAASEE